MPVKQKNAPSPQVWNKGLEVGQKDAFTPAQVNRIRDALSDRGVPGLRDLALFQVALDTMLLGRDLVALKVKDVQSPSGTIRSVIDVASKKQSIQCALTKRTATALGKWIKESGIKRSDYLFPSARYSGALSVRQFSRLVKSWVIEAGIDPKNYGTHSLRRTKALHILNSTGDLDAVGSLLGHRKLLSTANYLSISKRSDPIALSSAFEI
jgi:site-specific recombinase XerD